MTRSRQLRSRQLRRDYCTSPEEKGNHDWLRVSPAPDPVSCRWKFWCWQVAITVTLPGRSRSSEDSSDLARKIWRDEATCPGSHRQRRNNQKFEPKTVNGARVSVMPRLGATCLRTHGAAGQWGRKWEAEDHVVWHCLPSPRKTPRTLLPSSYLLRKAERQHGPVLAKQKWRDEEEKWSSRQYQCLSRRDG